jgi:hypothetical protein
VSALLARQHVTQSGPRSQLVRKHIRLHVTHSVQPGGRMIIPLGENRDAQQLVQIDKTEAGLPETPLLPVRFVPLVHGRAGVAARAQKRPRAAKPDGA